jgi:hypothetical protein
MGRMGEMCFERGEVGRGGFAGRPDGVAGGGFGKPRDGRLGSHLRRTPVRRYGVGKARDGRLGSLRHAKQTPGKLPDPVPAAAIVPYIPYHIGKYILLS